jgi:hypothetical protein
MFKDIFKKHLTVDVLKPIPYANDLLEKKKINITQYVLNNIPFTIKNSEEKGYYNFFL